MTVAPEGPHTTAGRGSEGRASSAPAGVVVGSASVLFGAVLLLLWIQQRVAPQLLRLPPVPFFDRLALSDRMGALPVAQLVGALALLAAGFAVLGRRRLAPVLFTLLGWGGLAFTVVAVWPGDELRFKMRTAVNFAQKNGVAGTDATFWNLVPSRYAWGIGVFAALWLGLLVLGTVHLLRSRELYDR